MRFYEPTITDATIGTSFLLNTENSHHFSHVLRGKLGDRLILFNGVSGEFQANVQEITKKSVAVTVESFDAINRTRSQAVSLVFALTTKTKMSLIIQKATELAVSNLYPIQAEFSQVKAEKQATQFNERYQKIIISAAMQSGLNVLPQLHQPCKLSELPWKDWGNAVKKVCHPGPQTIVTAPSTPPSVVWFVGPEGGWSHAEIQEFMRKDCVMQTLSPTILRMETACIAALSVGLMSQPSG